MKLRPSDLTLSRASEKPSASSIIGMVMPARSCTVLTNQSGIVVSVSAIATAAATTSGRWAFTVSA